MVLEDIQPSYKHILPNIKSAINYLKIAKSKNIRVFFNTDPENPCDIKKNKKAKFNEKIPELQAAGDLQKGNQIEFSDINIGNPTESANDLSFDIGSDEGDSMFVLNKNKPN